MNSSYHVIWKWWRFYYVINFKSKSKPHFRNHKYPSTHSVSKSQYTSVPASVRCFRRWSGFKLFGFLHSNRGGLPFGSLQWTGVGRSGWRGGLLCDGVQASECHCVGSWLLAWSILTMQFWNRLLFLGWWENKRWHTWSWSNSHWFWNTA